MTYTSEDAAFRARLLSDLGMTEDPRWSITELLKRHRTQVLTKEGLGVPVLDARLDAIETDYVKHVNEDDRQSLGISTNTVPTGASTSGTGDMVGLSFVHGVRGNHTGVPNNPSPGYFFGMNSYTYTGDQASDCAGLGVLYGNLLETVIRLPVGAQEIGSVSGLASHVGFSGASAGSTVDRMISMHVQAPVRKDGATAGNANLVYGLMVEAVNALGPSTHVRSLYVEGGTSQINSIIWYDDANGTVTDTVASSQLHLTANSTGAGTAPFIKLYPGNHGTKPTKIELKVSSLDILTGANTASLSAASSGELTLTSGRLKVQNQTNPWISVNDTVGADAHPGGNGADHILGGIQGYTHFGAYIAGSIEFRSIFNVNDYSGCDIVFSPRNSAGTKNDQLRLYGQGGVAINIPGVGLRTVEVGAIDSGGVGYRMLRVTN